MKKINEDIYAPNIATTDENASINGLFQQLKLPSLGRSIFTVTPIHGPTAAIFNIKKNASGNTAIVRQNITVYNSVPKKTDITNEAIDDISNQFGEEAKEMIAVYLKGLVNDEENEKTINFLKTNSVSYDPLSLTEPNMPDLTWREISMKVQQCVLYMNRNYVRTYNAFCVLPYKYAAGIMSVFADMRNSELADINSLFIGKSGLTDWYVNPDASDTNVYVGLRDISGTGRECAVFTPYTSEITTAMDPESGKRYFYMWNRYAITISPLHDNTDPMLMKFALSES